MDSELDSGREPAGRSDGQGVGGGSSLYWSRYLEGTGSNTWSEFNSVNFDMTSILTWITIILPRHWGNSTWASRTPAWPKARTA